MASIIIGHSSKIGPTRFDRCRPRGSKRLPTITGDLHVIHVMKHNFLFELLALPGDELMAGQIASVGIVVMTEVAAGS